MNNINAKNFLIIFMILITVFISISKYNYIFLFIILGIIFVCKNIKNIDLIFNIALFCCLGLGASFNLKYRVSIFFIADVSMIMLTLSIIFRYRLRFFRSKEINILLFITISYFILGIISGYNAYNIFQDFKLALYVIVFTIYFYMRSKDKNQLNKKYFKVNFYCIIISLFIQEVVHLKDIGIVSMVSNGFGQRDVNIPVQILPIFAGILICLRKKINSIIYYSIHLIILISVCISFTRTVWVQYVISIVISIIVCLIHNKRVNILKGLVLTLIFLSIIGYFDFSLILKNNEIALGIIERIESIKVFDIGNAEGLQGRMNVSEKLIDDKFNFRIILGYGMGDTFAAEHFIDKPRTFIENSYLMIIWKYGIVSGILLTVLLLKNVIYMLKTKDLLSRITLLMLFIGLSIGNFSGVPTNYYFIVTPIFFLMYKKISFKYLVLLE